MTENPRSDMARIRFQTAAGTENLFVNSLARKIYQEIYIYFFNLSTTLIHFTGETHIGSPLDLDITWETQDSAVDTNQISHEK